MEPKYKDILKRLGYDQMVCDIFANWENVKDEILVSERKTGTGNGTIHVFLGAADSDLRKEFPNYYMAVEAGEDTAIHAVPVKHYFVASNLISMLGYVSQYHFHKQESFENEIKDILRLIDSNSSNGLLETSSLFKLSTGSNKLRPYFKQFDSNGVFTKLVRKLLLPNSAYKIYLLKNSSTNQYSAFWLIGFDDLSNFEANSNADLIKSQKTTNQEFNTQQIIYYGAPGTGKSHAIEVATEGQDVIRTTFHPDSDYSTFVGAYKPTTKEIPMRDVTGKVIIENGKQVTENRIVYEFVSQAFLQAYVGAWEKFAANGDQPQPQYLVIEEINRGNCAQIFGDLFQLLDRNNKGFSEYPIKADADMKKQLNRLLKGLTIENPDKINALYKGKDIMGQVLDGDILLLPSNLYIWATMNTSDQSLFPIDSAFKRRWEWRYVRIDNAHKDWKIEANGKKYDWWDFLEKINAIVGETTSSEDKKLGYFFCKTPNGIISSETFVSKVIFYLWNDVFKDYEFEGDVFNDEPIEGKTNKLSFDKFYLTDATGKTVVNESKVDVFLTNLGVKFDDGEEDELDNNDENNEAKRNIANRLLLSVAFPDGSKFDTDDGLTHFAVYYESIKKIGVERVEPIAAASKYHRLKRPVISKERFPEIEESNRYSYEQLGEYFLIKGMSEDTYINILNLCNEQLNLGIDIKYKE